MSPDFYFVLGAIVLYGIGLLQGYRAGYVDGETKATSDTSLNTRTD